MLYPYDVVAFIFEYFEDCIEHALPDLSACLVRLTAKNGELSCRIALDSVKNNVPKNRRLKECERLGATITVEKCDDTLYSTLTFGKKEARI